jgi:hypothetical protein
LFKNWKASVSMSMPLIDTLFRSRHARAMRASSTRLPLQVVLRVLKASISCFGLQAFQEPPLLLSANV